MKKETLSNVLENESIEIYEIISDSQELKGPLDKKYLRMFKEQHNDDVCGLCQVFDTKIVSVLYVGQLAWLSKKNQEKK